MFPWGTIAGCFFVYSLVPLVIRWILAGENMLRGGGYGQGYNNTRIEPITAEGKEVPKVCVPLRFTLLVFDLTTVRHINL